MSDFSKIRSAVEAGDSEQVLSILKSHPEFAIEESWFGSLLHLCVGASSGVAMAEALVSLGAPLDLANAPGMTALDRALHVGDLEIFTFLVDSGAGRNAKTIKDDPLYRAAMSDAPSFVRVLLERGFDPQQVYPGDETVAKHCVRLRADSEVLALLGMKSRLHFLKDEMHEYSPLDQSGVEKVEHGWSKEMPDSLKRFYQRDFPDGFIISQPAENPEAERLDLKLFHTPYSILSFNPEFDPGRYFMGWPADNLIWIWTSEGEASTVALFDAQAKETSPSLSYAQFLETLCEMGQLEPSLRWSYLMGLLGR